MSRPTPRIVLLFLALFAVTTPVNAFAWEKSPINNTLALDPGGLLYSPVSVSDGANGVMTVAVEFDLVASQPYLVMSRVDAAGVPVFGTSGVRAVTLPAETQTQLQAVSDGAGGVFCAVLSRASSTSPYRARVYRIGADGNVIGPAEGRAVNLTANLQSEVWITPDGQGGVIVACIEDRGATGFDIVVQRFDANVSRVWGNAGVVVSSASGTQDSPVVAGDGTGGAYVAYEDLSGSSRDVRVNRVDASGAIRFGSSGQLIIPSFGIQNDPRIAVDVHGRAFVTCRTEANELWGDVKVALVDPAFGLVADLDLTVSDGFEQFGIEVVPDALGGAFVTWVERIADFSLPYQVRAQYLSPGATPRWPAPGIAVAPTDAAQLDAVPAFDGIGGLIVAFEDERWGQDVFAQRLDANGVATWGATGLAVSLALQSQVSPRVVVGDDGSAIVTWTDTRVSGNSSVYAQRIDRHGLLGDPAPTITAVQDFPQDQGGVLIVEWDASDRDVPGDAIVTDYVVLRRLAGGFAPIARADVAIRVDSMVRATGFDAGFATNLVVAGWESLVVLPALQLPAYSYAAASYGDQTSTNTPVTELKVVARGSTGMVFESASASGTSTDDLAPGAPAALVAARAGADAQLTWSPPLEPVEDLREYRVYRGIDPAFVPGPSSLVGASSDTTLVDPSPGVGTFYYLVTAVDVHDNEGDPSALAMLSSATSVDGPRALRTRLFANAPNPFNPSTELRFELAAAGHVELAVFDTRGRRVTTLLADARDAGAHRVVWNGTSDDGRVVASGTYFARLTTREGAHTHKMILAK